VLSEDDERPVKFERMCALVVAAVAFITPWLALSGSPAPYDTSPGTIPDTAPFWIPLVVWILVLTCGAALVIAGRGRRVGTALIVGDAVGVLLFFVSLGLTSP
jgi:hypothetical protein